ncbi:MAG TPA: biopolymer transporter ExbD [Gemmatimonadaceae bacterium]|nr:biopolymer transporter ExbD [Gemmatimonadaceae bacterium]
MSSEPNVTPMIDVLLVLLIIFMAVLPSMRKAIDIQLPDPNPQVATANNNSNQIVLEVHGNGQYNINSAAVQGAANLGPRLKEIYDPRPEKILFVKGDPKAKYADIIEAMDIARGAIGQHVIIGVPPKDTGPAAAGK